MDKKKKAAIKKQEDQALTRALLWFAAAMVLEFLLLLVNKYYIGFVASAEAIALAQLLHVVIRVVAPVALVGGALMAWWCRTESAKRGELAFGHLLLAAVLLAAGIGCGLIAVFYAVAVELLCVVVPALGVLALVYYLYQKEFFLSCLGAGVGLLGLWLIRRGSARLSLAVSAVVLVCLVALVALLVLVLCLKKQDGTLTVKGKHMTLFNKQANYLPVILSCVFGLLALAVGLVLGSTAAFYLLFGLLAWLLVLLVYYTVKLM